MLAQFTLQLIAGISLMWVLMPRRQVTSGFFRIQMLLVLGLSVLVALTAGQLAPTTTDKTAPVRWETWLGMVIGLTAFAGSILWTLERRKAGGICAFIIWGLANLALDSAFRGTLAPNWLGLLSAGATAAVLGGTVTGMLLGHWYLTAPTMSIAPLTKLTQIFGLSLIVRLIVSGLAWYLGSDALQGSLLWTWFALRWLAGILAPLVLCGMTLQILRYRNTQAATGVLFAAVILTFIGELSAALLSSELHCPF
ncbi:MAG: hypothetical protein B7Z55_11100 [Planctomycetales bacterium 12-60-4]|nr:MAG: hypothetical protein B7Z55_11100 [Planctomycetales bacterium 12-60-4]